GEKDAKHMQPDKHDHRVSRPPMHVAHEHAERHIELEIFHVSVGIFRHRPVIEHQIDAGNGSDEKHEKSETSHAPSKTHAHRMTPHFGRMEMEEDIGSHHHHPVTRCVVVTVAKDRFPNLALNDIVFNLFKQAHDFF